MDAHQDPWVPAPRDGDRADVRAGGREGGDPWSPTVPFPRVAPAAERLPGRVAPAADPVGARSAALVTVPAHSTALVTRDTAHPGLLRTCTRVVARIAHATVDGVRSLVALLVAAPASR